MKVPATSMKAAANPESPETPIRLGRRLVEMGKISENDVATIVVKQREDDQLFGEAAVGLGLVTREELQHALAEQYAYPSVEVIGSNLSSLLVTAHRPFGAEAEVFRGLRSQLLMRWLNEQRRTVAVVAGRTQQGTSIIAANLALCFAQLGERTLLVDANLRNPRQHELFGCKNVVGLSTVLTGRSDFREPMIAVPPFNTLSLLTSGPIPPNPQELLSRVAFSYLIETAPSSFDVIIIDTPPILEYADAQIVAAIATGCLLVTRRNHTRVADIELVKREIAPTGASLIGTVISE